MKLLIRISFGAISIIPVLTTIFYFWGSSPYFKETEYAGIIDYGFGQHNIDTDTFSVVTYNIGYLSGMNNNVSIRSDQSFYNQNLNKAKGFIKTCNPSFIGFQEIDYYSRRSYFIDQLDSIASYAGYGFGAAAINWDKKYVPFPYWPPWVHFGRVLSGQGILSKFPITFNKRIILPKPPSNPFYYNAFYLDRLIQISEVAINDASLIIVNVHLEAFDKETREHQAELLRDVILDYVDLQPLLLIGDFNSRPPFRGVDSNSEKTISLILEIPGMVAAISEEVYIEDPEKHMTYKSDHPYEKLDYIFYNSGFVKKLEAGTLYEAGMASDHLPVYMKFILNNN
jgi:endonuclease/exonuclease/phosphatase family metal-dependent hydrolase